MRRLLITVAIVGLVAASTAQAATPQQEKMATCNKEATGMKGDDRKDFMKKCLSAEAPAPKMTQQEKMTACNKEAAGKKGDERKAFMSDCLKG